MRSSAIVRANRNLVASTWSLAVDLRKVVTIRMTFIGRVVTRKDIEIISNMIVSRAFDSTPDEAEDSDRRCSSEGDGRLCPRAWRRAPALTTALTMRAFR